MTTSPGTVISGRYKIVRLLGDGGFGVVYLAEDIRLGRKKVAVKKSFDSSPEARKQFLLEAQLLADLQHAGLPKVTDHFIEGQSQFLVMDYVEGDDLTDLVIKRNRQLAEREAVNIVLQICDAVAYLHTRRPDPIIHRDIKPSNIKITRDNRAVLVDFGIAKIYQPKKVTVKVAKAISPHFSPPEQYTGRTDARSDVYALGATLHCRVCADLPADAMERLQGFPLRRPSDVNPTISSVLEQIILQALDLNPDSRFLNANRLSAALRAFLQGLPVAVQSGIAQGGIICPRCKTTNRSLAKFCQKCGGMLSRQSVVAPSAGGDSDNLPPEILFEIANTYARNERYTDAISRYLACLRSGGSGPTIYHNLGLSYILNEQYQESVACLEKGASLYPADGDIQFQLARSFYRLDRKTEALKCAENACKLNSSEESCYAFYGSLLLEQKNFSEATQQFEKCIKINSQSAAGHIGLGRTYGEKQDLKNAIAHLKKAAQIDTKNAEPHFWMGILYAAANKKKEAISAFETTLRIDPNSAMGYYLLGETYREQEEYAQALPHFQRASSINPKDPDFHAKVALCFALLDRRKKQNRRLKEHYN